MLVKLFSASGYQNECSVHTAWLNIFWLSGEQEIGKVTSLVTFEAASLWASARAPDENGHVARMAAATMPLRRMCVMALSSQVSRPVLRPVRYAVGCGL